MWVILGFIIIAAIVMSLKYEKTTFQPRINPYSAKNPLTPTEAGFYRLLTEALPEYLVLPQVQLSSFIKVDKSITGPKNFYSYFNPVAQQSVDYLICRQDFSIVAAVELDDRYHNSEDARKRDAKKSENLKSACIQLIRWHAETLPSLADIRVAFEAIASKSTIQDRPYSGRSEDSFTDFLRNQATGLAGNIVKTALLKIMLISFVVVIAVYLLSQLPAYFANAIHHVIPTPKIIESQSPQIPLQSLSQASPPNKEPISPAEVPEQSPPNQANTRIENEAMKEEAWKKYYQPDSSCEKGTNLVECGNKYIRAKKKFEAEWEDGKL